MLPVEIILAVFSFCDQDSLWNCAQVCKDWNHWTKEFRFCFVPGITCSPLRRKDEVIRERGEDEDIEGRGFLSDLKIKWKVSKRWNEEIPDCTSQILTKKIYQLLKIESNKKSDALTLILAVSEREKYIMYDPPTELLDSHVTSIGCKVRFSEENNELIQSIEHRNNIQKSMASR
jgi:hypothetical protein